MSRRFYGSICLEDLFGDAIVSTPDGRRFISIDNLTQAPFNKGQNGKSYANVQAWVNDVPDQFGNMMSISLPITKEQVAQGMKNKYIGNMKESIAQQAPAPVQQSAMPQGGMPWQQPTQGIYPQQAPSYPQQTHAPFPAPQGPVTYPQQTAPQGPAPYGDLPF